MQIRQLTKRILGEPSLFLGLVAAVSGVSWLLNWVVNWRLSRWGESAPLVKAKDLFPALLCALVFVVMLHLFRRIARGFVLHASLPQRAKDAYAKYDWVSY